MPPQTNATLTAVRPTRSGESFDGPAAAGPASWEGVEPVYLRERRDRRREAVAGDVVLDRVLIVDADVQIDWRVGHVVTFERHDQPGPEDGTVKLVERRTINDPDIPPELQTVRLTLDPA